MQKIKCPKCGEECSENSLYCAHCGSKLPEENKKFCVQCGNELENDAKSCAHCSGSANGEDNNKQVTLEIEKVKNNNENLRKNKSLFIFFIVLIIATLGSILIKTFVDRKKEEVLSMRYQINLSTITYSIINGAADVETCGNKIKSVWSNTIWEIDDIETDKFTKNNGVFNDDFNDSLNLLFADSDFKEIINSVKNNQKEVNEFMIELKNPPAEWEEAYGVLKEYYDNYLDFMNYCTNPSGSLQTYSIEFNTADKNVLNSYNKINLYLK